MLSGTASPWCLGPLAAQYVTVANVVRPHDCSLATERATSVCPDLHAEMPRLLDYWYVLVIEAIEATGGPSLIDRVAPAEWLVERGAMLPVPI